MNVLGSCHDAWADAVGAYLLGALPADEEDGFARHLAVCPACREAVADLRVAADALALSACPVEPPAALKESLMAVVRSEAELLAAAGTAADRPVPARRRRASRFGGWLPKPVLGLACALALLAVGAVGGALLAGGGEDVRVVAAQVDQRRAAGARAALEIRDSRGVMVVEGMPAPPAGRVYQVWLKRPGRDPEPTAALWSVTRDGSGRVAVPGSLTGVEAVLVTDEPAGGARTPSRAPMIQAEPT